MAGPLNSVAGPGRVFVELERDAREKQQTSARDELISASLKYGYAPHSHRRTRDLKRTGRETRSGRWTSGKILVFWDPPRFSGKGARQGQPRRKATAATNPRNKSRLGAVK